MNLEDKAVTLLNDWQQYKKVHYSAKTQFAAAVDIEIEKEAVAELAKFLLEGLTLSSVDKKELLYRIGIFEEHLRIFKDRLTFELLKNGN